MAGGKLVLVSNRRRQRTKDLSKTISKAITRRAETKQAQTVYLNSLLSASITGYCQPANPVVFNNHLKVEQGFAAFQRIGNEVRLTRLGGNITVFSNIALTPAQQNQSYRVRVILLGWIADPVAADLLLPNENGNVLLSSPIKPIYGKALVDKIVYLKPFNSFTANIKFSRKMKKTLKFITPADNTPDNYHVNMYLMSEFNPVTLSTDIQACTQLNFMYTDS